MPTLLTTPLLFGLFAKPAKYDPDIKEGLDTLIAAYHKFIYNGVHKTGDSLPREVSFVTSITQPNGDVATWWRSYDDCNYSLHRAAPPYKRRRPTRTLAKIHDKILFRKMP